MKSLALLLGLLAAAASATAAVETYKIDPVHSSVGFSIRHFVSKVPGSFTRFSGTIAVDRSQLEQSSVSAVIEVGSISTANDNRDKHLKSPDFFDAGKFATMSFKSTAWKQTGTDTFDVTGDLTIKDVTKPATLKVTLLGFGPGMRGAQLSGWEATAVIKKSDYNLAGPAMLSAALGDEVTINITVEAALQQ